MLNNLVAFPKRIIVGEFFVRMGQISKTETPHNLLLFFASILQTHHQTLFASIGQTRKTVLATHHNFGRYFANIHFANSSSDSICQYWTDSRLVFNSEHITELTLNWQVHGHIYHDLHLDHHHQLHPQLVGLNV